MHEGVVEERRGGGFPWGFPNQKDGFLKNKNSKEVPLSHFVDVVYMILKQQLTNIDNFNIIINMLHFRSCTVALPDLSFRWLK